MPIITSFSRLFHRIGIRVVPSAVLVFRKCKITHILLHMVNSRDDFVGNPTHPCSSTVISYIPSDDRRYTA